MNALSALVLGLLIGWLAEWAIDWVYWRNRIRPVAEENANLKDQIKILEAEKIRDHQIKAAPKRKAKTTSKQSKGLALSFHSA